MLNVSYENPIGSVKNVQTNPYEGTKEYTLTLCHCNALVAMMYFYTNDEGTEMVQLVNFLADVQHLKNIFKDKDNGGKWFIEEYPEWTLNAKEMDTRHWQMVKELTKHGIKVIIQ